MASMLRTSRLQHFYECEKQENCCCLHKKKGEKSPLTSAKAEIQSRAILYAKDGG